MRTWTRLRAFVACAILLLATSASAEEAKLFSMTGQFRLPLIGRWSRLTGSVLPTIQGSWRVPWEAADVRVGVEGSYGIDLPRWAIILGGIYGQVGGRPYDRLPATVTLSAALLGGRMPVINAWGLPLNYSGLYPRAGIEAAWEPRKDLTVGAGCDGYVVMTYSWEGLAPAPKVFFSGRF